MKRILCTACVNMPLRLKQTVRCHECNNTGWIEYNDTQCTHLPPMKIEFEAMCSGWMCECGASGPWNSAYNAAYERAKEALE